MYENSGVGFRICLRILMEVVEFRSRNFRCLGICEAWEFGTLGILMFGNSDGGLQFGNSHGSSGVQKFQTFGIFLPVRGPWEFF